MRKTILYFFTLMIMTTDAIAQQGKIFSVTWEKAGSLPAPAGMKALGVAGPVAGIHDDMLIVAGGANFPDAMPWQGGRKRYYDEGFVFQPAADGSAVHKASFRLPFPLAYGANCSTSYGIVSAGGENEQGVSGKVFLLQWDQASGNVRVRPLPDLPVPVANAAVAAIGPHVYLAGGEMKAGVANHFFVLDLTKAEAGWKLLPPVPQAASHAVLLAQAGGSEPALYLLGGRKRNNGSTSDLYASVYRYGTESGSWTEKSPLPYPLSAGTGIVAGDRQLLLFGGDRGTTFHRAEGLIAAIAQETDSVKKQALEQQKIQVQSTHPGFDKTVLSYDLEKDAWMPAGDIPFAVPVTTTAIPWRGRVFIPSGEVRAGVRTPDILLGTICAGKRDFNAKNK